MLKSIDQPTPDQQLDTAKEGQGSHLLGSLKAVINIENLRLRTFIGFNEEEIEKQQDVVINCEIEYQMKPGCLRDEVDQALDYKVITKQIIKHVESGKFLLLEKLVGDVLGICLAPEPVISAKVTIDKPHALRFADSVSLTLAQEKQ